MITTIASAGSLESGDVLISVSPANVGRKIELNSSVYKQFGEQILASVNEVLDEYDIKNVTIKIEDKGALDLVIRARLKTAIFRASLKDYDWESELC
ncbi:MULTISPECIES: citrate lyase acyl carrier protein [unclassified Campylobacter]|uniref:citrate lyase acyl carrier protein n=1 Tax=unclassified Campylobacter TaxID=2593542 RepID=UPI001EFA46F7|nr:MULTISPECIES: citrate lyase acyl carrier protein [unclassified Campylobacter]ULO03925.1 citrate lyase [acyl carrier protein] component [Campylobacter sp. RM12651]